MTPGEARRIHRKKLLHKYGINGKQIAADSRENPTMNQVYYWHRQYKTEHYGAVTDSIEKLKLFIDTEFYKKQGIYFC
jgi:hypothetical protein